MSSPSTSLSLAALIDIRKQARPALRFAHSQLDQFPGMRLGPRRGQGIEFEDLREYLPGDDIRHIDWNVTARTNQPHTRLYREDREHTTTVVIDLRPNMFTGSTVLKAVKACELAAISMWQAMYYGDRCAAIVFSHNGITATRPSSSERGVLRACELIANTFGDAQLAIQTKALGSTSAGRAAETKLNSNAEPDLQHLLNWLANAGRRTGTYILFSGFDNFSVKEGAKLLAALGRRRRVSPVLLLDALEIDGLPSGDYAYKTQDVEKQVTLNSKSSVNLTQKLQQLLGETRSVFKAAHVPLIEFDTRREASKFLMQYTQSRQLQ